QRHPPGSGGGGGRRPDWARPAGASKLLGGGRLFARARHTPLAFSVRVPYPSATTSATGVHSQCHGFAIGTTTRRQPRSSWALLSVPWQVSPPECSSR